MTGVLAIDSPVTPSNCSRHVKGLTSYVRLWTVKHNQSTQMEAMQEQGEDANSTERPQLADSNPGQSCCEATVLTTASLCHPDSNLPEK